MNQEGPVVWVVGAQHWPRALLRAELIERGMDAVGFVYVGDALRMMQRVVRRPAAVIVDLRQQRIAAGRLAALARSGALLIALGGSLELANPDVVSFPWTMRLQLPVTLGEVAARVRRLLPETTVGEGR